MMDDPNTINRNDGFVTTDDEQSDHGTNDTKSDIEETSETGAGALPMSMSMPQFPSSPAQVMDDTATPTQVEIEIPRIRKQDQLEEEEEKQHDRDDDEQVALVNVGRDRAEMESLLNQSKDSSDRIHVKKKWFSSIGSRRRDRSRREKKSELPDYFTHAEMGDSPEEVGDVLDQWRTRVSEMNDPSEIDVYRQVLIRACRGFKERRPSVWNRELGQEFSRCLKYANSRISFLQGKTEEKQDDIEGDEDGATAVMENMFNNPREYAMMLLQEDGYQHDVNMRQFVRIFLGWSCIILICHVPWLLAIVLIEREIREQGANCFANGTGEQYDKFLKGFAGILVIGFLLSMVFSLATTVDQGANW